MKMRITSSFKILAAFFLVGAVLFSGLGSAQAIETQPYPEVSVEDALFLREIAVNEINRIDNKVSELNAKKRGELMKKVDQLSYYASRSKGFIEAKMSMMVFTYPDAFIWQSFLIFARYWVVYPAMYATGTAWLIPYVEPLPIEFAMTQPYIWMRKQMSRKIFDFRVGVDPEYLKSLLFQDLGVDLRTTNLHRLDPKDAKEGTYWLLPVHDGKAEQDWISIQDLENLVTSKEPEYIRQLKLLNLDPEDYQRNLQLKIEEDEELAQRLLEKAKKLAIDGSVPEEKRRLMEFYLLTQDVFNSTRLDITHSVPELGLMKPKTYIPWFGGLLAKIWMAFKLNRFRSFQTHTLGKYYMMRQKDPHAARELLEQAFLQVNVERDGLVTGTNKLKDYFTKHLEHSEPRITSKLRCEALFN